MIRKVEKECEQLRSTLDEMSSALNRVLVAADPLAATESIVDKILLETSSKKRLSMDKYRDRSPLSKLLGYLHFEELLCRRRLSNDSK